MLVDIEYYNSLGFAEGDVGELEKVLLRAERLIDLVTFGKCREFENLPGTAQHSLKHAICAQAENYIIHGFDDKSIDAKVKIGDFSYESKSGGVISSLSSVAAATLKLAGLLYSGAEVR
jgi:hypothetical protein